MRAGLAHFQNGGKTNKHACCMILLISRLARFRLLWKLAQRTLSVNERVHTVTAPSSCESV